MAIHSPITVARFWSKVKVGSGSECWTWTGAIGSNGYGRFRPPGCEPEHAHRIAWEIANVERLGRRFACHTCDNKRCVNPGHLYAGSHATNTRDAMDRGLLPGPPRDMRGEGNPRAKLSKADVSEIFRLFGLGLSNMQIAARFPVSHSMVSRIRTGRSWQSVVGSSNQEENRKSDVST